MNDTAKVIHEHQQSDRDHHSHHSHHSSHGHHSHHSHQSHSRSSRRGRYTREQRHNIEHQKKMHRQKVWLNVRRTIFIVLLLLSLIAVIYFLNNPSITLGFENFTWRK